MVFSKAFHLSRMSILATIIALIFTTLASTSCSSPKSTTVNTKAGQTESIFVPPTPEPPRFTAVSEIQSLSVDQIFKKEATPTYNLDPAKIRTMIATGDVIPARVTNLTMVQKNNFKYPFEATADYLKNADITFINLEAPLVKGCQATNEGMSFCGDQRFIEGLTYARVNIANLANNHAGNDGLEGLSETIDLLTKNRIAAVGAGSPVIKNIKGLRFGFLGYNGVGPQFDREAIKKDIADLRPRVDVLVVAMHWGKEYVSVPDTTPGIADDDPREMGRLVIDAGADIVIGNHPHWVQGLEIYKGKLITYAHGNFIFDQEWSQETKEGVVGKYTFYDNKLVSVDYSPVVIENYAQPHFVTGPAGQTILDRMETASRQMAGGAVTPN